MSTPDMTVPPEMLAFGAGLVGFVGICVYQLRQHPDRFRDCECRHLNDCPILAPMTTRDYVNGIRAKIERNTACRCKHAYYCESPAVLALRKWDPPRGCENWKYDARTGDYTEPETGVRMSGIPSSAYDRLVWQPKPPEFGAKKAVFARKKRPIGERDA